MPRKVMLFILPGCECGVLSQPRWELSGGHSSLATSMGPGVLEGSSVFLLSGGPGAAFSCARMKGDGVIVYIRFLARLWARLLLDWGRLTEGLADGAGVS